MLRALIFAAPVKIRGARLHAAAGIVLLACASCSHRTRASSPTVPARIGSVEQGVASWYGAPYDGRRAASGEIFDMQKLTAAHRTLPFETWLEVTNLANGRRVNVRVNDRGPFVRGRIIDLSLAAAQEIDMVRSGTAEVRLKVIPPPSRVSTFTVQAGAFSSAERAEALRQSLPFEAVRVIDPQGPGLWRVLVGHGLSQMDARALGDRVREITGEIRIVREE